MKPIDLTNQRFGRLTAIELTGERVAGKLMWRCVCDCGTETRANAPQLRTGARVSCGCAKVAGNQLKVKTPKHGHCAGGKSTRTYKTWNGIITRCTNPKAAHFQHYGGRGIKVCARWMESFESFLADMGEKPPGLTIERKDVNGDYCPENCRWATELEQHSNRRDNFYITHKGRTASAAQWAREMGFERHTVADRIKRLGWTAERAIETPILTPSEAAQASNRARWGRYRAALAARGKHA